MLDCCKMPHFKLFSLQNRVRVRPLGHPPTNLDIKLEDYLQGIFQVATVKTTPKLKMR
jgi:hypothetical protein